MLVDVFENFRNKYIAIYKLDAAHFLSVPGLTWSACLKSTRVKLELLTKNYMLMMIGKWIRCEICHLTCRCAKANKDMKNYKKNIEWSYLKNLDANKLYRWAMFQKLPMNGFNWKRMYLHFMKSS